MAPIDSLCESRTCKVQLWPAAAGSLKPGLNLVSMKIGNRDMSASVLPMTIVKIVALGLCSHIPTRRVNRQWKTRHGIVFTTLGLDKATPPCR